MMPGMMALPLTTTSILRHAATWHAGATAASRSVEGPVTHRTYGEIRDRSAQLTAACAAIGLRPGDAVATLAWNGSRHLELYFGLANGGFVSHPINPRLFSAQLDFILRDAGDKALFLDLTFLPILESLDPTLDCMRRIVVMTDRAHMPAAGGRPLLCYEELLEAQPVADIWPALDEATACGLCHTSGTTGNPKGVTYTHRSTVLHAMAICLPDVFDLSATSVIMPVVPMFHVNAWGIPYAAPLVGASLVLPGPKLDGASLHELILGEGVTVTAGVPTVWMGLLDWVEAQGAALGPLQRVIVGGAACPPQLIDRFAALGVEARHAWGMTEISPVGLANAPKRRHAALPPAERAAIAIKQGRPMYGVELSIVDADGAEVPRDGKTFGDLRVRGPWVCAAYLGDRDPTAHTVDGWFRTGDVATIDGDGFVQIVDRTRDMIKSGGEWISSIELERIAGTHPAVREAAVIARPDPRWGERPLLVVTLRPGCTVERDALLAHYRGKTANWCIPHDVVVVEEIPHTGTGKVLKSQLRAQFGAGHR